MGDRVILKLHQCLHLWIVHLSSFISKPVDIFSIFDDWSICLYQIYSRLSLTPGVANNFNSPKKWLPSHYILRYHMTSSIISRGKSRVLHQLWHPNKGSFAFKHLYEYCIVLDTKVLLFSSICVNILLFSTHRGVMTSNNVREECLECHMTSNDVREECYITVMTGRCVNKPGQTEPVGCYENSSISNLTQLCK